MQTWVLKAALALAPLMVAIGAIAQPADNGTGPVAVPVPEPGALELLIVGGVAALVIGLVKRRK